MYRFSVCLSVWLLGSLVGLIALNLWNPLLYFLVAYTGFLVAVEYSEPLGDRPTWHRRMDWVVVAGFFVFVRLAVSWVEQVTGTSLL